MFLGPVGTAVGSMVGGMAGGWLGDKVGSWIGGEKDSIGFVVAISIGVNGSLI